MRRKKAVVDAAIGHATWFRAGCRGAECVSGPYLFALLADLLDVNLPLRLPLAASVPYLNPNSLAGSGRLIFEIIGFADRQRLARRARGPPQRVVGARRP